MIIQILLIILFIIIMYTTNVLKNPVFGNNKKYNKKRWSPLYRGSVIAARYIVDINVEHILFSTRA